MGNGYVLAETLGTESVTLAIAQIPAHNHPFLASNNNGGATSPSGNSLARNASTDGYTNDTSGGLVQLNTSTISPVGGSQPHDNMAPFLCVSFIISLFGIFPTPN